MKGERVVVYFVKVVNCFDVEQMNSLGTVNPISYVKQINKLHLVDSCTVINVFDLAEEDENLI